MQRGAVRRRRALFPGEEAVMVTLEAAPMAEAVVARPVSLERVRAVVTATVTAEAAVGAVGAVLEVLELVERMILVLAQDLSRLVMDQVV